MTASGRLSRVSGLARLGTGFASRHFAAQALSFAAGLVIVNWLPVSEYALYTVVLSVASSASLLAGTGFGSFLQSRGAPLQDAPDKFTAVVRAAQRARTFAAALVAAPTAAGVWFLTSKQGANTLEAAMFAAVALLFVVVGAQGAVYRDVMLIERRHRGVQNIDVAVAVLRVAAVVPLLWVFGGYALLVVVLALAVNVGVVVRQWQSCPALSNTPVPADDDEQVASSLSRAVRRSFLRLLPSNFYLVFQTQIGLVVIAVLGTTEGLAQLGAVTRFALVFGVVSAAASIVLGPRFAAVEDAEVGRWIRRWLTAAAVAAVSLLLPFLLFPHLFLAVLGPDYRYATSLLLLVMIAAAIAAFADVMNSLNQSRDWISFIWLQVPFSIAAMVVVYTSMDPASPATAAILTLAYSGVRLVVHLGQLCFGCAKARLRVMNVDGASKGLGLSLQEERSMISENVGAKT